MRRNSSEPLTLDIIAAEAGSSSYHFARLFLAYTGETPFAFLRRIRLTNALRMLAEQPRSPVTEIALSVGYETSAAFNKVFKKSLNINPSDFRRLGKERQRELIYHLSEPRVQKEIMVNLTTKFDVVARPLTHYLYLEKHGPFPEIAPATWNDFFPLLEGQVDHASVLAYLGLSGIDKTKVGEQAMIYAAGVALCSAAQQEPPQGLSYREVPAGNYARFVLTGPYPQIWPAFNQIFKSLADSNIELRPEFCIEDYRNNPKITPEAELLTELLIPVA
jgi:AraC-like DNA-binding protein/DNA gyrase inhibitor GyrI